MNNSKEREGALGGGTGAGTAGTRGTDSTGGLGRGTGVGAAGADTPIASNSADDTGGLATSGEGQGDDLSNRLGGTGPGAGMSGASAATGDMSAGRSEADDDAPETNAPGGGDPGGMGGLATRGSRSTAGGGVSPIQRDED
jgi:hypothetical protein